METPTGEPKATEPATAAPPPAPVDARQRWRITFCRDLRPGGQGLVGRDYLASWDDALVRSALPIAQTSAGRYRFSLAAPLPASSAGEAELAELWLTARVPAWQLREALTPPLPPDHRIVALEDVWMGTPALAGRIAAADYRITLANGPDESSVVAAAQRLLDARSLPRERAKGNTVKSYDLRPQLISIRVGGLGTGEGLIVRLRTRIHPELGSGRPEEALAALADELGMPLEGAATVRERLVLAEDLER